MFLQQNIWTTELLIWKLFITNRTTQPWQCAARCFQSATASTASTYKLITTLEVWVSATNKTVWRNKPTSCGSYKKKTKNIKIKSRMTRKCSVHYPPVSCTFSPRPGGTEGAMMSLHSCNSFFFFNSCEWQVFPLSLRSDDASSVLQSPPSKKKKHYGIGQSNFLRLHLLHVLTRTSQHVKTPTRTSGNAHKHVTHKSSSTWPWTWWTISIIRQKASLRQIWTQLSLIIFKGSVVMWLQSEKKPIQPLHNVQTKWSFPPEDSILSPSILTHFMYRIRNYNIKKRADIAT